MQKIIVGGTPLLGVHTRENTTGKRKQVGNENR